MSSSIVSRISCSRLASTAAAAILTTSIGVSGWQDWAIAQSTPYTSTVTCADSPVPPVRPSRPDPMWEQGKSDILQIADAQDGGQIGPRQAVSAIVFSSDGSVLASGGVASTSEGSEPVINIWNTQQIQNDLPRAFKIRTISLHENEYIVSLAFSPDGNCLVSGALNGAVRLWNRRTGELIHTFVESGEIDTAKSLAFTSDGRMLAVGSLDGTVRLWSMNDRSLQRIIDVQTGVEEIAFMPDGTSIAVLTIRGNIAFWDWRNEGESLRSQLISPLSVRSNPESLAIGPDNHQIMAFSSYRGSPSGVLMEDPSQYNSIYLVSTQDLSQIGEPLRGHSDYIRDLDFSASGLQLISVSSDATVRIWDTQRQSQIRRFARDDDPRLGLSFDSPIFSVAFHPSGRSFAVGRHDGSIQLYIARD